MASTKSCVACSTPPSGNVLLQEREPYYTCRSNKPGWYINKYIIYEKCFRCKDLEIIIGFEDVLERIDDDDQSSDDLIFDMSED